MEENNIIRSLAALAHNFRLQVFRMLVVIGPTGMIPGAIAEQLDVSGMALSFHLKGLINVHLMTQERDGRSLIYRAAHDHIDIPLDLLAANCCQDEACLEADTTACKC